MNVKNCILSHIIHTKQQAGQVKYFWKTDYPLATKHT
jgi:hypothetical protein